MISFSMKAASIALLSGAVLWAAPSVRADRLRPVRGPVNMSVFLCKYKGQATPPKAAGYYEDLFFKAGTGGLQDYWTDMSDRAARTSGAVRGWYELASTVDQAKARTRAEQYNECVAKVKQVTGYSAPSDDVVVVVTYPGIDLWGSAGQVFAAWDSPLGAFQHETGHGIGLAHSYTNITSYCNADWALRGEYGDKWDVMSWANNFGWQTSLFSNSGTGLNAYNLDRMGWVPMDRVFRFGEDGLFDKTLTLTALSEPRGTGYHMVRIPFNGTDNQQYYTVEYRVPDKWDRGITGGSKVLVHEVAKKPATKCGTGAALESTYRSYLLGTSLSAPIETIQMNGIRLYVLSKDATAKTATVRITSTKALAPGYGPNACKSGYVWRQADSRDYVCTTPARRDAVQVENSLASSRRDPNGGAYGSNTCLTGYVWREAWPGDYVCVPAASRSTAKAENVASYGLLAYP